jgi:predicted DNA-binding transcriptional regulator AlpA
MTNDSVTDSHSKPSQLRQQLQAKLQARHVSPRPALPSPTDFDARPPGLRQTEINRVKAPPSPSPDGALLLPDEVAAKLRITAKALEHMRRRGDGPQPIRLGARGVRYTAQAVEAFLAGFSSDRSGS